VAGNYEAYVDSGLLEFSAETGHERASLVLAELLDLLRELRDAGPTDAELEGVKQRFRWQLDLLLDSVTEAAQFFATELQNGTRRSPMQRWHEINAVSREALMTVAQRWLTASNLTLIAVGSLSKAQLKSVERLVASFT
jgi:predicted Zn-dependent peptidase